MNEEKQLLEEIKKEITEGITEEVLKRVEDKLVKFRELGNNTDEEEKQKAVEYIRAKYFNDLAKVKVLSSGTTGEGAELVPTYLSSEVLRVAGQYGVVRQNARIYSVSGLKENIPTADGVVAYRKNELAEGTASTVSTNYAVELSLEEVMALVPFSNKLLANPTINVVTLIATLAGEALAKQEDTWGLVGEANGEGVLQNANVNVVTLPATKTSYSDVTADDLLDALSLLDEGVLGNAKFYMSFSVFNALRKKKDLQNRYILQMPSEGRPATIWNVPVVFSAVMPKTSDAGQAGKPFMFVGDLNYLIVGEMGGLSMDISKEASVKIGAETYNLYQRNMSAVRFVAYKDIKVASPNKAFAVIKTASA